MKRRPSPSTSARRFTFGNHAFTLVEMLIVLTIIALLVGVLLPALAAARRVRAAPFASRTCVSGAWP